MRRLRYRAVKQFGWGRKVGKQKANNWSRSSIPTHLTTCNNVFRCIKKPRRQNRNRLLLNGDHRGENASLQRKNWSSEKAANRSFQLVQGSSSDKANTGNWHQGETNQLMEKAMAPHSSTLAWKIPWMEEPGRLQSMGSLRVGHDWATSLSLFTFMHWRRKGQPTPVFLPGESQGRGSLVGCRLWGRTESDTTEAT